MARAEAPKSLNEPSSQAHLLQFLREQAVRNGNVIDGQDPYRQVAILLNNLSLRADVTDSKPFKAVESVFPPTPEDLEGK
jgi:hypothetical protein